MRAPKNIAKMSLLDTIQVWKNANAILLDKRKLDMHADASQAKALIRKEWERRQKLPFDPSEFFNWPSTEAPGGNGRIDTYGWQPEGVLKCLGYQVGQNGLRKNHRQQILDEIFGGPIPPLFPADYLREWGPPCTAQRLQKMAETIAALARNAKRKRYAEMEAAIVHWKEDLEYLYYKYYIEKFKFAWPSTELI